MMGVLQGNLHRCQAAQLLLPQIATERNADILILSEQYRDLRTTDGWFSNASGTSAIWVRGAMGRRVQASSYGEDFVWVRVGTITYVSVYLSPNVAARVFEEKIGTLEDALRDLPGDLIVAGDLNSRAIEWGMPATDKRGRLLLEMAARLELVVANTGRTPTYLRPGFGYSIPDVTMTSDSISSRISRWRVIDDFTASDHQYIVFEVLSSTSTPRNVQRGGLQPKRFNLAKQNHDRFREALLEAVAPSEAVPEDLTEGTVTWTDYIVEETMTLITRLCEASMPRKRNVPDRRAMYWWSDEISLIRRDCIACRRRLHRARKRGNPNVDELSVAYKTARKRLTYAINDSKKRCWRRLCEEVDRDPWGLGYKIVTQKLGSHGPPERKDKSIMDVIVGGLFPTHPVTEGPSDYRGLAVPDFGEVELLQATSSLKSGKAPGPDCIPAEILRQVSIVRPRLLLDMYNASLRTGRFATRWKTARLVLLYKGKGELETPSSYRPLSLLDTAGKLYEALLKPRITSAITAAGGLAENQHGFRKGHSTIGAIREVTEAFLRTRRVCYGARPLVLLATLDVRNAFNSARWGDILEALRAFRVPPYLLRVVGDYLTDRRITYETTEGQACRPITAGVAQGSILGPDFWNAVYDGLLRLEMPENASLIAYADDVAVVIVQRNPELAQLTLNRVMLRVDGWMTSHGLTLALAKTELILLTGRRIQTVIPMTVGSVQTQTRGKVKYLGVTLDTKLTFWPHIQETAHRAATRVSALSRLMANTYGPRPGKRRLLMATTHSILLYGAEVWADALEVKKYRKRLTNVQRQGALRIACAYRTVSAEAVLVVAGVIPIDLLARERKRTYERSADVGRTNAAVEERDRTMREWTDRWLTDVTATWTRRLISSLVSWTGRGFGEVNFYLTQFLTGHGYFRQYLFRCNRVRSPECKYCGYERDDAEHTFYVCRRWTTDRLSLETRTGSITPENTVARMLQDEDSWTAIATFVEAVLRGKKADGCLE